MTLTDTVNTRNAGVQQWGCTVYPLIKKCGLSALISLRCSFTQGDKITTGKPAKY